MNTTYYVLLFSILIMGCAGTKETGTEKFDAPLRKKIAESTKDTGKIQILGKCSTQISDDMRRQIESSGIRLNTVAGDTFTAECTVDEIKTLAHIEFVSQLQLSVQRNMLNQP